MSGRKAHDDDDSGDSDAGEFGRGDIGEVTVRSFPAPAADTDSELDDPLHEAPPPMRPAEILERATKLRLHPDIVWNDPDAHTVQVTEASMLETALAAARHDLEETEAQRARLLGALADLDEALEQTRTIIADIESRLARGSGE